MTTTDRPTDTDSPSTLSAAQLAELTELLTQERAALSNPPPDAAAQSTDLTDDPGTRLSEREVTETLTGLQATQLEQVELALARIDAGTYGICEGCGEAIPHARLEVVPSAAYCVDCQAGVG